MTLNPDGTAKAVSGLKEMMEKMIAKMNLPAGSATQMAKAQLEQQYSDESMKQNMNRMFATFPKEPVGIGDSWNTTVIVPMMNSRLVANITYTLKAVQGGVATIGAVGAMTTEKEAAPAEAAEGPTPIDVTAQMEGTVNVDVATGWTVGGQMTQNISGKVSMGQGPAWPITINSVITLQPKEEGK